MTAAPTLPTVDQRVQTIVAALDGKQGERISVLDVAPIAAIVERFVLVSGANPRQIHALGGAVNDAMKMLDGSVAVIEGWGDANWVLFDYGDIVVHIFLKEARAYYDLDRLWADAKTLSALVSS